jgi:acyl dehydratase
MRGQMRYHPRVATAIREYRVLARNTSASSENKIHDDAVARQYGFRGALVPGTTVYAYLTRAIIASLGVEWLERGQATLRLIKPVYDAEEVTVRATAADGGMLEATAANARDEACAVVRASISNAPVAVVDLAAYPRAELPAERPPAVRDVLERLKVLGSVEVVYDEATAAEYLDRVDDPESIYRAGVDHPKSVYRGGVDDPSSIHRRGYAHPAFYLQQANRALSQNVRLGPWIHVGSEVQHLAAVRVGARISARGRVARVFEKKGHQFVTLDLLLIADEVRAIAHVRHTAIYQVMSSPDASRIGD